MISGRCLPITEILLGLSMNNDGVQGGKRSGKRFTSRCHVHDICQALMASMAFPQPGEIYNIADDDSSSRETVIDYACSQFELLRPEKEGSQEPRKARCKFCTIGWKKSVDALSNVYHVVLYYLNIRHHRDARPCCNKESSILVSHLWGACNTLLA